MRRSRRGSAALCTWATRRACSALTSERYQWDGVIRIIARVEGISDYAALSRSKRRALVNKYPLFVAYYCAVRLELALKAVVVPVFGASAYMGIFEWSPTGAMVHLHYALTKPGALRNDVRKHVVVCSDAPIDPDDCIVAKPAYIGLDF